MDAQDVRNYLAGKTTKLEDSQPAGVEVPPNPSEDPKQTSVETHEPEQTPSQVETGDHDSAAPSPEKEDQTAKGNPAPNATEEKPPKLSQEEKAAKKAKDLEALRSDPKLSGDKSLPFPNPNPNSAQQYKANRKFIQLKQRSKAKIESLQSEIARLNAQITKLQGTDTSSMTDTQKADLALDVKLAQHDALNAQAQIDSEKASLEAAEADEIHEARVAACFTEPSEVEHYHKLLENGREKFVQFLSQVDPENAVLSYLDDCDISPLMVRLLMTRPDILKSVVSKRSPMSKMIELRTIESKLQFARKSKAQNPQTNPSQDSTPKQPVATTGRVVGNGATTPPNAQPKTANDWKNYLKTHK